MKKALSLILALLFTFSCFSCASKPGRDSKILSNDSTLVLNAEEAYDAGVSLAVADAAYVRGGQYSGMTMSELPQSGYLFIKNDGGTTRHIVLKFDISNFTPPAEANAVKVAVTFYSISDIKETAEIKEMKLRAYKEDASWTSDSVTFDSLSPLSDENLIGEDHLIKGDVFIDITEYFNECKANGDKYLSVRLVPNTQTVAEMRVYDASHKLAPRIVAKKEEVRSYYQPQLLVNEAANQAIWDYAQSIYSSWKSRYDQIVAKGDYPTNEINVDPSQYTIKTNVSLKGDKNESHTFDTRLITTLNGFDANAESNKLDEFGGVISDTRYEATGYFYTKKIGDRWMMIDPLGYPCHITGINHTNYAYSQSRYQTNAMNKLYGTDEKWALSTTRWLTKDLGFNVALGTPHEILSVEKGLSTIIYTTSLAQYASSVGLNASTGGTTRFLYNGTMPVFDPAFEKYMEAELPSSVIDFANNPRVVGYISDNELPVVDSMLTDYLTLDPSIAANHYSYACAWTWISEFTGKKCEEIDIFSLKKLGDEMGIDLYQLFKGFVYDRYFSVIQPIVKKTCPNQLYLGVRLLTASDWGEWVARFDGYWCDVMCINYYGNWEASVDAIKDLQRWTGKPIMITEFYAKGEDAYGADGKLFTNTDGAGWVCKNQTERGYFYQNFTLRLLEAKNCVGWLYFQYIDNDPTDETIESGQSNSNKGIVNSDLDREVYKAYHSQIGLINNNKYMLIEYFDNVNYFK